MKNNQKLIDDVEKVKGVCQRLLNYIERQKQNTITLQKAASLARKGDRQGAMRLKSQVDNQPKVFDGASFEDVMPTTQRALEIAELVAGGGVMGHRFTQRIYTCDLCAETPEDGEKMWFMGNGAWCEDCCNADQPPTEKE